MTHRDLLAGAWEGVDEGDCCCGRGWAVIDGDTMMGRIFIHAGDDSSFTTERIA